MYAKIPQTEVKSESGESILFHDTKGIPRTQAEMDWAIEVGYVIPSFRNGSVDVEKLLDYVDVKLDWYVPSEEAFNVINFIRLSMGREPENLNSKAHYFFIDAMLGSEEIKPYYTVRGMDFDDMVGNALILSTREFSKALAYDTMIATPNGDVAIEDIEDGDYVYSRTGKPTRVKKKSPMFFDTTFEMKLADGRSFKSSNDHEHILWRRKDKYIGYFDENGKRVKKGEGKLFRISGMEEVVMTSQDLEIEGVRNIRKITENHRRGDECKYFMPMIDNPIEYPEVDFPIDPYTVGVILGDGSIAKGNKLVNGETGKTKGRTVICSHIDDYEELISYIPYDLNVRWHKGKETCAILNMPNNMNKCIADNLGTDRSYTKKIPSILMKGSSQQRLEVLKGLMDTDGTVNKKGSASFTSVSKQLAEDVRDIVYSLGGSAYISERTTESNFGIAYSVMIRINKSIFKLKRKKDRETYIPSRNFVAIDSFEMVSSVPSYCLAVECPTKSFVMSNGLLTHNSVLVTFFILYIAYTGKKKGFGRVNLLLYVSDRMEGNVKATMRTIKGLVKKSAFLSEAFEETYFTDANVRLIRHPRSPKEIKAFRKGIAEGKSLDQIMFRGQRTFTLQGVGSSGGRGSRDEDLARPDGVVFDDLIANERDAFSKAILESIESTITADVGSSLSGNKNFQIFIGTAYHTNDPIYKRAGNGTVLPVVFPRAEVAPHGDIYDKDGKLVKKALTKEEFISVWEDRHGFEKQRKAYREAEKALAAGDSKLIRTRNQEYYVRVVSSSDRLIPEESIKFKNCIDVILNAKNYSWFVTTDYTTSKAVGSDLSGAALWARDYLGNSYLMDLSLHLKSIEEQYDDTINFVKKATGWGARWVDVGVEIDGQQAAHLYGLRKRSDERGVPLYLARQIDPQNKGVTWEGIRSKGSGDKLWRLKLIEPEFSSSRVYFNETLKYSDDLDELLREIALTTNLEIKSKHDDGLDLLSQLALIQQWHELPNQPISETLDTNVYNSEFKDIQEPLDDDSKYTISY